MRRWLLVAPLWLALSATATAQEAPAAPADGSPKVDVAASEAAMRIFRTTREGAAMDQAAAAAVLAGLTETPDDIDARYRLLGYYKDKLNAKVFAARREQILWFVNHRPDDPILATVWVDVTMPLERETYEKAMQAFSEKIKEPPKNARILGNASRFAMRKDRDAVTDLLERAREIEPQNPEWARKLAGVYQYRAFTQGHPMFHEQAYRGWLDVHDLVDGEERLRLLPKIAVSALNAGLADEARRWAQASLDSVEALKARRLHGDAVNVGHTVLGRLAFADGDVDAAIAHLRASAKTPGSLQLNTFGPNLKLAEQISQAGHRDVVIEYLQACAEFWVGGRDRIEEWVGVLREGDTPFFGNNLKI